MKRPFHEPLARTVGRLLGETVLERWPRRPFTCVLPVPMHRTRRFARGIHTAAVLAEYLAQTIRVPMNPRLLLSRRKTKKQGTLTPAERDRNVRGAFRVSAGYDITDAHLLLVDDIMTTGATVSESARQLKRARAASVSVAVVARGTGVAYR
jgi:ComF family protein